MYITIKDYIKNTNFNSVVVEKKILKSFSDNFWILCDNSLVFTTTEKLLIKQYLSKQKINLVNENWFSDTLVKITTAAKDRGGKIWNNIKSKIITIKNNIKQLCSDIANFVKEIINSIFQTTTNKIDELKNKEKTNIESKLKDIEYNGEIKNEIKQLKYTVTYLYKYFKNNKLNNNINSDNIDMNLDSDLNELIAESIDTDILSSFYIIENNNNVWGGFKKWFLDMEHDTPNDGRLKWFVKLTLKIIALILSPIVKTLEVATKYVSKNVLRMTSELTKRLGGMGVYDFAILSGILAGIPALFIELSLVTHNMDHEYAEIFEIVSEFLTELSGIKILLVIFGGFCTAMTFYQLIEEFKHLLDSTTHI